MEELESFKTIEGIYKVHLLLVDDVVNGSNVFELAICWVGSI